MAPHKDFAQEMLRALRTEFSDWVKEVYKKFDELQWIKLAELPAEKVSMLENNIVSSINSLKETLDAIKETSNYKSKFNNERVLEELQELHLQLVKLAQWKMTAHKDLIVRKLVKINNLIITSFKHWNDELAWIVSLFDFNWFTKLVEIPEDLKTLLKFFVYNCKVVIHNRVDKEVIFIEAQFNEVIDKNWAKNFLKWLLNKE